MLELRNISFARRGNSVFDNLSWKVDDPGRYLLLGSNSSGKSVLCNMLSGRIRPDSGSVEIDAGTTGHSAGSRCFYASARERPLINEQLWDYLSVELQNTGNTAAEISQAWDHVAGFYPEGRNTPLFELSHGQYLLAHILLASLIPARLILLDGHLTFLNQKACGVVDLLLAHSPVSVDRFILFTSNRQAHFLPFVNQVFAITESEPRRITELSSGEIWDDPVHRTAGGRVLRLTFREEWTDISGLVSGINFKLLSQSDSGIRLELTGSLDEMLDEFSQAGLNPWRLEWEN